MEYIQSKVFNEQIPNVILYVYDYSVTSDRDATCIFCDPTGFIKGALDKRVVEAFGKQLSGNI